MFRSIRVLRSTMLNRALRSADSFKHNKIWKAAAISVFILAVAAAIFINPAYGGIVVNDIRPEGELVLSDGRTGAEYARYPMRDGDTFSVGFIHSVNKSPLTDFYEVRDGSIFVEKTIYYGFGAGVQTEIEEGQTLEYGEDGSMIVSGFDKEIPDLLYIVGTVSDHTLRINGGEEISLRDLCGRTALVRFQYVT